MLLGCVHLSLPPQHGLRHSDSGLDDGSGLSLLSPPSVLPLPCHAPRTARVASALVTFLVSNTSTITHCHYKEVPTPSHDIRGPGHPAFESPLATKPKSTLQPEAFHSVPQDSCGHSCPFPLSPTRLDSASMMALSTV